MPDQIRKYSIRTLLLQPEIYRIIGEAKENKGKKPEKKKQHAKRNLELEILKYLNTRTDLVILMDIVRGANIYAGGVVSRHLARLVDEGMAIKTFGIRSQNNQSTYGYQITEPGRERLRDLLTSC